MSVWTAILVLAAGALLGVIVTLIANQEPGDLLGFFIIVGAIAAALGIKRGKVYLLFPVPALAFFVAAIVTGKVHDAKLGSSAAGLSAGFTQWVAGIFFPAVVATIVVLLVGGGRWVLGRQLVIGQSPLSAERPIPGSARPAPGSRRPAIDDWADENPFDGSPPRSAQTGPSPGQGTGPTPRQGTGPTPRQGTGPSRNWQGGSNGTHPSRSSRDQRTDRDPWGDSRSPEDHGQPAGPRPRPNGQGRPAPQSGSDPRPSWNPALGPAAKRPPRRQPPVG